MWAFSLGVILGGLAACSGGGAATNPSVIPANNAASLPPAPENLCAGASGDMSSTGGIEGTGIRIKGAGRGPASKRASLVVAGQAWDISHASIMIDGQPATPAQIVDGQITVVQGKPAATAAGTADSVVSETRVAGPITQVDSTADPTDATVAGHLVLLGQQVRLLTNTILELSPQALAVGDTVEVSALVTADGTLVATRVARRPVDLEYFVTGTVSSHDEVARTLVINALSVDYGSTTPQGFPTGAIQDGDLVRVFGRLSVASTTLSARAVEFRLATLPGPIGEQIALNGYITRFASAADFDVDGVPITTSAATDFQPVNLVALSDYVTVCGTLISSGQVAATRVIDEEGGPSLAGTIQSIDTQRGVLQVFGATLATDATTRVLDEQTGPPRALALSDLRVDDFVWVKLIWVSGANRASLIERRGPSAVFITRGTVLIRSAGTLDVNGVSVVIDQHTRYFGSCNASALVVGVPQSPAWGPCSPDAFWGDFATWQGPLVPDFMVAGTTRPSDGAAVASAVVVIWN